ncbi:MAG: hypothetical protein OEY20_15105 [Gemmatimonadota bacterium]|nr:hypothetical protein [Gemmatimonadota bacterium]
MAIALAFLAALIAVQMGPSSSGVAVSASRDPEPGLDDGTSSRVLGPLDGPQSEAALPDVARHSLESVVAADAGGDLLRIHIRIRSSFGVTEDVQNGTISGALIRPTGRHPFQVNVETGHCVIPLKGATEVALDKLVSATLEYLPTSWVRRVPASREAQCVFARSAEVPIDVLDCSTMEHLKGIEVVECKSPFDVDLPRPPQHGGAKPDQVGLDSPIRLRGSGLTSVWWIRAPGFGWSRIALDHSSSEPRSLLLCEAAELEVFIDRGVGVEYSGSSTLCVYEAESKGSRRLVLEATGEVVDRAIHEGFPVLMEGLITGAHEVEWLIGSELSGVVVATARADLVAGRQSLRIGPPVDQRLPGTVELVIDTPGNEAGTGIEVKLYPSEEDGRPIRPIRLRGRSVSGANSEGEPGRSTTIRYDAVPAGRYFAFFRPWNVFRPIEVAPGGFQTVLIELPSLIDVELTWNPTPTADIGVSPGAVAWLPAESKAFESAATKFDPFVLESKNVLHAGAGVGELIVLYGNGTLRRLDFDLHPGGEPLTLPAPIERRLLDEEVSLPDTFYELTLMLSQARAAVPASATWWESVRLEPSDEITLTPMWDPSGQFASEAKLVSRSVTRVEILLPPIVGYEVDERIDGYLGAAVNHEQLVVQVRLPGR